jgi:hypothetical protein
MRIALVNDVMAAVEAMRRVILSQREHEVALISTPAMSRTSS